MSHASDHDRPLLMVASPLVWAAHFLATYCTAAIWCEKLAAPSHAPVSMGLVLGLYTLLALATIGWVGKQGFERHRRASSMPSHESHVRTDRQGFVGYVTLLLSALSAVAVLYSALAIAMVRSC